MFQYGSSAGYPVFFVQNFLKDISYSGSFLNIRRQYKLLHSLGIIEAVF